MGANLAWHDELAVSVQALRVGKGRFQFKRLAYGLDLVTLDQDRARLDDLIGRAQGNDRAVGNEYLHVEPRATTGSRGSQLA